MTRNHLLRVGLPVLGLAILIPLIAAQIGSEGTPPPETPTPAGVVGLIPHNATADHSQFAILQQDFKTGPEVTAACLTCHTEASSQIMKTSHWTWICPRAKKQLEEEQHIAVGKAEHIINNFCIALPSNEPRCTSCHAGYGWKDKSFDFGDETLVDCLVCHDQTGEYRKFPTAAGHPVYESTPMAKREWPKGSGKHWEPADLTRIAQNVGAPSRRNCGTCHFFGGGGEGVKHGDMDVTLTNPHRGLDVHMNADGANFTCTQCHTTRDHSIAGRCFEIPAYEDREFVLRGLETNLLACEACHTTNPHRNPQAGDFNNRKLNDHADKVSCQACHIPAMAPEKATKTWWDWSQAGDKERKPQEMTGTDGEKDYNFKKGEFIWVKNVEPEYVWFDGSLKHSFFGDKVNDVTPAGEKCDHAHGRLDKIDHSKPVVFINRVETGYDNPKARIWPTKIMRGIQPYDTQNKTLLIPKLFPGSGPDKGEAYWKCYDWSRSIKAGMEYAGLPYSGEYDWIQTEMIWPLKHMVVPKESALTCTECHNPEGRLAHLAGFYMPGRDNSALVDVLGIIMIAGAVVLSLLHGLGRIVLGAKG